MATWHRVAATNPSRAGEFRVSVDRTSSWLATARSMLLVVLGTTSIGCETTVTEYHRRSSFYTQGEEGSQASEFVTPSGTRVVFIEDGPLPSQKRVLDERRVEREEEAKRKRARMRAEARRAGRPIPAEAMEPEPPKAVKPREVRDDGSVVYRAILPEHVIGNTMTCLRNQEYDALWNHVVSENARRGYLASGKSQEAFVKWCVANRGELMMTLNRMSFGYYGGSDVVVDQLANMRFRVRFSPHLGQQFKFRELTIVQEGFGMKLGGIQ